MRRIPSLTALACCLAALSAAPAADASPNMESTFQDDPLLVYNTPEGTAHTMDILKALGADRLRISVFWNLVAPDAKSKTRPSFDATDPAAYPPGAWDRYDRIVQLAAERGMGVNFNVTSPAPFWATGKPSRSDIEQNFDPSAAEFGLFLRALGTRYSGKYVPGESGPPLPRVDYWSIWNEPNQPGWLTPQWGQDPRQPKDFVETAPRIYRNLVDAAYASLADTGHKDDTILIGETAPKGVNKLGITRAIKPARFIRQLYCLDDNFQFLQGTSAELRGCPVSNQAAQMAEQHPGLFHATGWAHHPYELTFAPHQKQADKEFLTIANLGDLSRLLRRVYQRYGQAIPGGKKDVPLYLTEFGYQTNPPDPIGVSPRRQAAYINEAEYIAYRDPAVRTLSQFLLVDDKPIAGYPRNSVGAWGSTFQSGLLNLDNSHKPAYDAYEMPVFLKASRIRRGRALRVWGMTRAAPTGAGQKVLVQVRGKKGSAYKTVKTLRSDNSRGYVSGSFKPQRSGALRLTWTDPAGTTHRSRAVSFTIVTKKKSGRR
jgi:hypothetical protein